MIKSKKQQHNAPISEAEAAAASVLDTRGLTAEEVAARREAGQGNIPFQARSKPVSQILRDNICTLFNALNLILALFVIFVAWTRPRLFVNLAFMGVIVTNTAIGIIQELRAKRTVDRLRVLTDPRVTVLRDGAEQTIRLNEIVLGDLLLLSSGNQIPVDCLFLNGDGFEVDESLLTGESDAVRKKPGEELFSGSFVVAGSCQARVIRVSEDTYAAGIAREVKRTKKNNSQIVHALNRIIQTLSVVIIPVGILLFSSKYLFERRTTDFGLTIVSTVAALVGMIPEGLMLMTSIAFAVGVVNLARRKTLVQILPSVETLARVDMLCLDKTGTLTNGQMDFLHLYPLDEGLQKALGPALEESFETRALSGDSWRGLLSGTAAEPGTTPESAALGAPEALRLLSATILAQKEKNATQLALDDLLQGFNPAALPEVTATIPFSSRRKWLAVRFRDQALVLGAPEFILDRESEDYRRHLPLLDRLTKGGNRVLLAALCPGGLNEELTHWVGEARPLAFLTLGDRLRPDVAETFEYFKKQGVTLKIISGDNANTVAAVAHRAGLPGAAKALDLSSIPEGTDLKPYAREYDVFGRVTPHRKRDLLHALQSDGHIVAMTGDGVNDVPALKDADCGIAMASGSDAARSAADLVLLEDNLNAIIDSVYEGRRVINNIERVATLFLVKTIYSCLLALLFIVFPRPFPIFPVQITLISSLTIGLPGFVLTLKPNRERVTGSFLRKVLFRCVPGGLTAFFTVLVIHLLGLVTHLTRLQLSGLSAIALITTGMIILAQVCRPWDIPKAILFGVCVTGFFLAAIFLPQWFFLNHLRDWDMLPYLVLLVLEYPMLRLMERWARHPSTHKLKKLASRLLHGVSRLCPKS